MSGPGSTTAEAGDKAISSTADGKAQLEFKFAAGVAMYGFVHNRWMTLEGGDFTWEEEYLGQLKWPLSEHDQRSDVFNQIHLIDKPLLLIHGADDDICPPSQSRVVFNSLYRRGVPTGMVRILQWPRLFLCLAHIGRVLSFSMPCSQCVRSHFCLTRCSTPAKATVSPMSKIMFVIACDECWRGSLRRYPQVLKRAQHFERKSL
jgi:hypothetical protein